MEKEAPRSGGSEHTASRANPRARSAGAGDENACRVDRPIGRKGIAMTTDERVTKEQFLKEVEQGSRRDGAEESIAGGASKLEAPLSVSTPPEILKLSKL